jgi:hypothetical protein
MKLLKIMTAALMATTLTMPLMLHAEGDGTPKKKQKVTKESEQIKSLEDQLKAQQAEIDALKAMISGIPAPKPEVDPIATPVAEKAAADAAAAAASASAASAKVDSLSSSVADLKSTTTGLSETVISSQKKIEDEIESPTALHYKGVLIQPGGFMAAETMLRGRAMNSNIATPFNSQPYGNSNNYYISEFNGSAQQSRISMLVTAPFSWGKAGGYFETDFLGAGTTSNDNQTNSYLLRVRSAFGQVLMNNGFSFQAGQMFTLATEDKKGVLAGPGAEALPPTIDPNYTVGFNFGRQYALRFADSMLGGKVSAAISVEQSQIIFTGSNAPANFFFGGAGAAGGLFNSTGGSSGGGSAAGAAAAVQNYTDNGAPDLHMKVAFDPGGKFGHYEIGGMARFFRERWYPQTLYTTTANTAATSTAGQNIWTPGGGIYASARVPATKYVDVALKGAFGAGTARYEAANLGDVTVREDGKLEPLRTVSGLFELDLHPTKKLDIFVLDGMAYLQRTTYKVVDVPGNIVQVGYGGITTQNDTGCYTQTAPVNATGYGYSATPSCSGATRYLLESSAGITYRFFNSPTKGRFQMQLIYSYLDRESWQGYKTGSYSAATGAFAAGTTFGSAQGINNLFSTSFRYYIP